MTALQAGQSQKNWQASVGMLTRVAAPHCGQVTVLSSKGTDLCPSCRSKFIAKPHGRNKQRNARFNVRRR
jgi:hypothetical protein